MWENCWLDLSGFRGVLGYFGNKIPQFLIHYMTKFFTIFGDFKKSYFMPYTPKKTKIFNSFIPHNSFITMFNLLPKTPLHSHKFTTFLISPKNMIKHSKSINTTIFTLRFEKLLLAQRVHSHSCISLLTLLLKKRCKKTFLRCLIKKTQRNKIWKKKLVSCVRHASGFYRLFSYDTHVIYF